MQYNAQEQNAPSLVNGWGHTTFMFRGNVAIPQLQNAEKAKHASALLTGFVRLCSPVTYQNII